MVSSAALYFAVRVCGEGRGGSGSGSGRRTCDELEGLGLELLVRHGCEVFGVERVRQWLGGLLLLVVVVGVGRSGDDGDTR